MRAALLIALLAATRSAAAHQVDYAHVHPAEYYERPPRERVHAYLGGGALVAPVARQDLPRLAGDADATVGAGGTIFGGVRLGPVFAVEVDYVRTHHGTDEGGSPAEDRVLAIEAVDFALKLHVPTRALVEPYFQLALGGAVLGDAQGRLAEGGSFALGGGVDLWLHPSLTVGARALYRSAALHEPDRSTRGDGAFVSVVAVDLNFQVHF